MDYQTRRKEQARQTEAAILNATMELSRETSFDKVSVRDICRAAGVTTGAFYHHFAAKEDLLTKGFAPMDSYMEETLRGHEEEPPLDRLWRILCAYAGFMEARGHELVARYYERRLVASSSASIDPTRYTLRAMLKCLKDMEDQGTLAEEQSPEWLADFLFRHFRGVVLDWIIHRGDYPLHTRLEQDYRFYARIFVQ